MCGITGVVLKDGTRVDPEALRRANDLICHRGPDDEGQFIDGSVGLAMRRLAIIDVAGGRQPISRDSGSLWIVFNGEIYNFQALREELEAKGHRFKTKTDTEVILALYEEHGDDCVKRLRGMFAFAIWDRRRKRLFIARDRIGKKPLVYCDEPGFFAFGSELRCLFRWPVSREIDMGAIDQFLSLQCIPSPRTIYKAAKKLPPGHTLVYEDHKATVARYWELPVGRPPVTTDFEEAKRLVADKLKESVGLRMISDVPLGAFLSGGVDSSVIVALMAEQSVRPLKTFSIGFEDEAFSELRFAKEVARRYGTQHTEFIVKPEMADVLPKLAWHYGEPYADASALPSYYVSRETRRFVTVALNGDGGDENFAGYVRYAAMNAARMLDALPHSGRSALMKLAELFPDGRGAPYGLSWRAKRFLRSTLLCELPARHLKVVGFFHEDEKDALYSAEFKRRLGGEAGCALRYVEDAFARCAGDDFVNRMLYVDFKTYLPECLLTKIDIATMAASLEGRSPLLDHEFIELVFPMPGKWKLKGLRGHKHLLKEAFRSRLPALIQNRGKMGFSIPLGAWLRGPLKAFWRERVLSPKALARGYFQEAALRRYWEEHQSGRDHGVRLWALLMLELWHLECLENGG